jgi:hypothetical protein
MYRYAHSSVRYGTYVYKHDWVSHVCSLIGGSGARSAFIFQFYPFARELNFATDTVCQKGQLNRHGVSISCLERRIVLVLLTRCINFFVVQILHRNVPYKHVHVFKEYFFSPPALPMTIDGLPRICFNAYLVLLIIPWLPSASAVPPERGHLGGFVLFETFPSTVLYVVYACSIHRGKSPCCSLVPWCYTWDHKKCTGIIGRT